MRGTLKRTTTHNASFQFSSSMRVHRRMYSWGILELLFACPLLPRDASATTQYLHLATHGCVGACIASYLPDVHQSAGMNCFVEVQHASLS